MTGGANSMRAHTWSYLPAGSCQQRTRLCVCIIGFGHAVQPTQQGGLDFPCVRIVWPVVEGVSPSFQPLLSHGACLLLAAQPSECLRLGKARPRWIVELQLD